ncbi:MULTISPECIES: hypothetical protein [Microbacterium]|jgi:hypothetical protein|uniref:hypothetical protein n=1 Tax=Microbacterium TaxID=33882 RepID=UPI001D171BF8|nr:hypothetical protein [Microbacterium testaceum]MCC4250243.1 hypothetical protein [Microbacterium testaceum]
MHQPSPRRRRNRLGALALILAATGILATPALVTAPAHAAERGTGFGTWAPLSSTGWHGSMRVGDVHTYCIHPGLPVATGPTTDLGVRTEVDGLTAQQLASINHLVTTYGQTDDPVQAASVGWAVKAIVDRDTTLHSWGYEGDSLREAIDYIMRRASPENSAAVQDRAEQYLTEAAAVRVPRVGGELELTTDADDPTRGTVTADVDPDAVGGLHLDGAVFADTGSADRSEVTPGVSYPILASPPAGNDGSPYTVTARGAFTVRAAAIRYFSTPGQQESAGPADPVRFDLTAEDATARPVRFSPRVRTEARLEDGRFVDEVTLSPGEGVWPRHADGTFVQLRARAGLYRTGAFPAESAEIPAGLEPVAHLEVTTDPAVGAGTYTATTDQPLPGPGVYTAVWSIERADQDAATIPHLPTHYRWVERFATPAQTEQLVAPPPPADAPTPTPTPTLVPPPAAEPPATSLAVTGTTQAALAPAGILAGSSIAVGIAVIAIARSRRRSIARA